MSIRTTVTDADVTHLYPHWALLLEVLWFALLESIQKRALAPLWYHCRHAYSAVAARRSEQHDTRRGGGGIAEVFLLAKRDHQWTDRLSCMMINDSPETALPADLSGWRWCRCSDLMERSASHFMLTELTSAYGVKWSDRIAATRRIQRRHRHSHTSSHHSTMAAQPRPSNIPEEDWASVQQQLARISGNSNGGGIPFDKLITAQPEDLGNDANLELLWAEKAFKHAETYYKILSIMLDKKKIKLTQIDEDIYQNFRTQFPADEFPGGIVSEETLKGDAAKVKWRSFCNAYEKNEGVRDFNMGTLLRLDASKEYEPANTCIVPRIQFFAIEIARCREGCNDGIKKQ